MCSVPLINFSYSQYNVQAFTKFIPESGRLNLVHIYTWALNDGSTNKVALDSISGLSSMYTSITQLLCKKARRSMLVMPLL